MSQTVAEVLVDVLEKIGVKHIFGLIGDSLNPLADAVRRSDIEWVGVRHEEGAALCRRRPSQAHGPLGSLLPAQPAPAAPISSPASMKRAATTRPVLATLRGDAAQDAGHGLLPGDTSQILLVP
jgi:glyoxylate carboligase